MAVFQKFRQVAGDDHHRPGGTRLGLLFSRQGVAYFGGRMWLRLTSERGAYFGFLMPHRTAPHRSECLDNSSSTPANQDNPRGDET